MERYSSRVFYRSCQLFLLPIVASKKIILTVNFQRSLYLSVSLQILLAAFSRSLCSRCSSLHRFRVHFNCGILLLPLYMFVSSVSWLYLHRNLRSIRVVGTVYLSRLLSAQVLSLCFAITVIYV